MVETDGSVTVTDQRTFEFPADGEAQETLKWLYTGFPENAEVKVKRVRLAAVDEAGNVVDEWTKLKSTTFQIPWRGGGRPEADGWAFDRFQGTLYAFVRNLPAKAVVEVTYKVSHAVTAFDDAADFQWLYAPLDYAVDLHNVMAKVILPVAADATVTPGDNVRAWGHGPADGAVDIGPDGAVTFTDPLVKSSAYAEGRVMFPVGWLTNLSDEDRLANQGSLQYQWTTGATCPTRRCRRRLWGACGAGTTRAPTTRWPACWTWCGAAWWRWPARTAVPWPWCCRRSFRRFPGKTRPTWHSCGPWPKGPTG